MPDASFLIDCLHTFPLVGPPEEVAAVEAERAAIRDRRNELKKSRGMHSLEADRAARIEWLEGKLKGQS